MTTDDLESGDTFTLAGQTYRVLRRNLASVRVTLEDRPSWVGSFTMSYLRARRDDVTAVTR